MKRTLLMLALFLVLAAPAAWFILGANRGWTRTSVAVKTVDEVTGIEAIEYRKQFVPGVDLLGATMLGAGLLAGAAAFFRSQKTKPNHT